MIENHDLAGRLAASAPRRDGLFDAREVVTTFDSPLLSYLDAIPAFWLVVWGRVEFPGLAPRLLWRRRRALTGTLALVALSDALGSSRKRFVTMPGQPGRWMWVVGVANGRDDAHLAYDDTGLAGFPDQQRLDGEWWPSKRPADIDVPARRVTVAELLRDAAVTGEAVTQRALDQVTALAWLLGIDTYRGGRSMPRRLRAEAWTRKLARRRGMLALASPNALITLHALGARVRVAGQDGSLVVDRVVGLAPGIRLRIAADGSFGPYVGADA
jgi:hypothetical protein